MVEVHKGVGESGRGSGEGLEREERNHFLKNVVQRPCWWIIQSEKMVLGGCPRIDIFPKSGRVGRVNKVMSLISKEVSVM